MNIHLQLIADAGALIACPFGYWLGRLSLRKENRALSRQVENLRAINGVLCKRIPKRAVNGRFVKRTAE